MKNKQIKGFSLIELMISLLIVSIVLSAALPAISRKSGIPEKIWDWTTENDIAYTATGSAQKILIGSNSDSVNGGRVSIVSDSNGYHIALYNGTTLAGRIANNDNSGVLLASDGTLTDSVIRIGKKDTAYTRDNIYFGSKKLSELSAAASSDIRKKNILGDNTAGLNEINQIKVHNFTFKNDKNKTPHVGVIAQEIKNILPNAVSKDGEGYYEVRYEDIFYAVVNAVKELSAKFTGLDKRIIELEEQNKQLKEQNEKIEKRLSALENKAVKKSK